MKQKTLSVLDSTVPDNLQNWFRSSLNINVDFEKNLDLWGKKFQRTSKEYYYFKSEMR